LIDKLSDAFVFNAVFEFDFGRALQNLCKLRGSVNKSVQDAVRRARIYDRARISADSSGAGGVMRLVKHLLEGKEDAIFAIAPNSPVLDAIRLMAEKSVGALVVMDEQKLAGIVSERDYARKVILKGRSSKDTPVSEIMSSPVLTVAPSDTINHCMKQVTEHRIRHLPVVDNQRVVGMLSIGDLVKAVIDDQAEQLEHLQKYIAG
jgi:CBS domain-containing protein